MGLKFIGKSEVTHEWTDKEGHRHQTTRQTHTFPGVPCRDIEDGEMAGFGGKALLLKTGLWAEDEPTRHEPASQKADK